MLLNDFHFFSETLGIQTATYVLLPEKRVLEEQNGKPLPTLYLLHGLSDDHTIWLRQTCVEQFAQKYRLAIVMPAVNRSFYTNMVHGEKYYDFVSQELPSLMEAVFPLSKERKDRFVAGLSMGGYGALKLAFLQPDRYAAAASFSGAIGMEDAYEHGTAPERIRMLDDIFGGREGIRSPENSLSLMAEVLLKTPEKIPLIYMACGTEDGLLPSNQRFVEKFGEALGIEFHTEPGAHQWSFWNKYIEKLLLWLPLDRAENAR